MSASPIVLHIEGVALERSDDGSFCVRDVDLAERAGMRQPRNVRTLIEDNREELEENGRLYVRTRRVRTSMPKGGERETDVPEYWLNEAQAYNLVALMRTPMAAKLRPLLARVFVEVRRQSERQQQASNTIWNRVLDALLAPKPADWELCFADSLVTQLAALDGYRWTSGRHPRYLRSTNRKIYDTIFSTDVGRALKERCPNPQKGDNFSQHLTPEARDYLRAQLRVVEAIARQSASKDDFWSRMDREYGGGLLQIPLYAGTPEA